MESNYYKEYFLLEKTHWWFQARLHILSSQIKKRIVKSNKPLKILNVGVASGATTLMLEKFGEVTSVEYDKECCLFLQNELNIEVVNASLTELPFENDTFDLVCAFDVVEHIENDKLAVQEIKRVLKPNGNYAITVPAYNFLWSKHDEINHHFRRYTTNSLKRIVDDAKLKTTYYTYFNFYFFLPILLVRGVSNLLQNVRENKIENNNTGSDFEKVNGSSLLNRILYKIFKSENFLLSKGVRFPFGVSMLFIGEKNNK